MTVLLVSLGAFVGAPARYLTDRGMQRRFGNRLPWGTLTVNLVASAVLGGLLGAGRHLDPNLAALLGTGFCATLSTYSTFSFEALRLHQSGARTRAVAYVTLTLVGGFTVAGAGWAIGSTLT
jgi:CrcB protein